MLSNANKLLSVMLLNAILLNVVMPSVVAPLSKPREKAAALTLSPREREKGRERSRMFRMLSSTCVVMEEGAKLLPMSLVSKGAKEDSELV